jgi:hypothetical protein
MRVVGEIPHPHCKITLFQWNNRYLIKLELGLLEQTYKIPEYDLTSEEEVKALVPPSFIAAAMTQFDAMAAALRAAKDAL